MSRKKEKVTRREFLGKSLKIGTGVVAASVASKFIGNKSSGKYSPYSIFAGGEKSLETVRKKGLAEGKIGGPTGFPGAERYQYGPDRAAGRAIEGLRKLKADGKAPKKLSFMIMAGCAGHWSTPFPEGAKAAKDIIFEETGIEIDVVSIVEEDMATKIVQDYQTGSRKYDIYTSWSNELADIAASGALQNLDEFMDKYKPDWVDPKLGLVGGEVTLASTSKVYGSVYNVVMDGDTELYYYRKDLMEDPEEQRKFKARYGWDLHPAETWEQWDQIGEFFTRPAQNLLGYTGLMNRYWGHLNWYPRFTSFAIPNQYYWDPDTGEPLIYSEAGIQATKEHVNSLKHHSKDGLSWGWPEQYSNFGAGGAATTVAVANLSKFLDNVDNPDSKPIHGKVMSALAPGRIINGKLVRRTDWYPDVGHQIASDSKYAEAAYLVMQWASDGLISSWLTANPAGYYDPCRITHLEDPLLVEKYHPYNMKTEYTSMLHCTPPITIPGVIEFQNALDIALQEAGTGRKTAEQAMKDATAEWNKIIKKIGREKHIQAVKASMESWPTVIDKPTI